jgi:hypothetical protein
MKADEVRFQEEHDDYLRDTFGRPIEYLPHTMVVGRVGNLAVSMFVSDELRDMTDRNAMELARQSIRRSLDEMRSER